MVPSLLVLCSRSEFFGAGIPVSRLKRLLKPSVALRIVADAALVVAALGAAVALRLLYLIFFAW